MSGEKSAIKVISKYVPPGVNVTPGEHYYLHFAGRHSDSLPDFGFYRAADGREFATEVYGVGRGAAIPAGSEKFARIKTAVEDYDRQTGKAIPA